MLTETMEYASDSTHWYTADGTPCYTMIGKNGKERPVTLRDARVLGLFPSVTAILKEAHAEGLQRWKLNQMMMAALTMTRAVDEPDTIFLSRIEQDSREEGRAAAQRGTNIHGAIEAFYRGGVPPDNLWEWVQVAKRTVAGVCGDAKWNAEKSFAHKAGYGGKVDLHCDDWVIDIKTKDEIEGVTPYDENIMQLAAYRRGLNRPHARCGIMFVGRIFPTAMIVEVKEPELYRGIEMFDCLLQYHRARTGHRP